jgi:hypothetical protein
MSYLPPNNPITLLFPVVYGTRECENILSVTSKSDFIMQNYYVKKWETIFTIHIKIARKN